MAKFPSEAWFEAVRRVYNGDDRYRGGGAGQCNCRAAAKVGKDAYLIVFEGAECAETRLAGAEELADVDFYLEMPADKWRDMVRDIAEHDGASLHYTLNTLDLDSDEGIARSVHGDQYREDLFFRYNQTFQYFFDASAQVATTFK
ncbi:MAG: hypothetical protein R3E86_02325 [Pseudomonadales bacterium]